MKSLRLSLSFSLLCAASLLLPRLGLAHDATHPDIIAFSRVGSYYKQEINHNDQDPFKGWFTVSVKNSGNEAWGDFHFQLFKVGSDFGTVFFGPEAPTSSQNPMSFTLSSDKTMLDLYFYGDPVQPGEIATFSVYTNNTKDKLPIFGMAMYPTPVPVPGAAWLLGCGLAGLAALGRKAKA